MCFQALKNVRRPKTAKKNIYGFKLVKEYSDTDYNMAKEIVKKII